MKNFIYLLVVVAIIFGVRSLMSGDKPLIGGPKLLENPYAASSPLHAPHQTFVDRVNGNPEILALFAGAGSEQALYRAWTDALHTGARTLSGKRLVAVTKTEVAIMARLPEASCAKLIRPRNHFDEALGADIAAAVEQLPAYHHKVMTEFTYDALAATVAKSPQIPVDKEQLGYAYDSLGSRYPGEYGQRLVNTLRNPRAASDEDACWAANSLLHTATDLNDDAAEALLRTVLADG
jgi:hypothetical protein